MALVCCRRPHTGLHIYLSVNYTSHQLTIVFRYNFQKLKIIFLLTIHKKN